MRSLIRIKADGDRQDQTSLVMMENARRGQNTVRRRANRQKYPAKNISAKYLSTLISTWGD